MKILALKTERRTTVKSLLGMCLECQEGEDEDIMTCVNLLFFSALLIYTFSSQQDIAENLDIDHWENKRGPRPWEE